MNENYSYRVYKKFNDEFEEFYTKMKKICDEYNVHLSSIRREQDILNYESDDRVGL